MLYYPVMNQIRLTFGFLCVGFAPYFHYVQFGGVLAAQVFYLMTQISCSPYIKTKDKILYPVIDFFYSIYLLCNYFFKLSFDWNGVGLLSKAL